MTSSEIKGGVRERKRDRRGRGVIEIKRDLERLGEI